MQKKQKIIPTTGFDPATPGLWAQYSPAELRRSSPTVHTSPSLFFRGGFERVNYVWRVCTKQSRMSTIR